MSVLTIRLSEEEKAQLAKRAKKAGLSTGALVRDLIRAEPIMTAADLLREMEPLMGQKNLRIRRR